MPRLLRSQPAVVRADWIGEERIDHFVTVVVDDQVTKAVGKVGTVTTTEEIGGDALTIAAHAFSVGQTGTATVQITENDADVSSGAARSIGKVFGSRAHPEFISVIIPETFQCTDGGVVEDKWTKLIPVRDSTGGIDFTPSEPEIGVGDG